MAGKPPIFVQWDNSDWHATAAKLMAETKYKTLPEFLRWRAKIVVQDLIAWTPPRSKKGDNVRKNGRPDWKAMRMAGEGKIRSEVRRLFPALDEVNPPAIRANARAWEYFERYMQAADLEKVEKMMRDFNINTEVLRRATSEKHRSSRGERGRVRKGLRFPVLHQASVEQVIKNAIKSVGKLKAGWMHSAKNLGAQGIPQWISGKSVPGETVDRTTDKKASIEMANFSNATKDMSESEIVGAALLANANKMHKELRIIMDKKLMKASRR